MGLLSAEQRYRIIEPLVDAGLEPEQIRDLLFRLAFDAVISGGSTTVADVATVVRDQSPAVQAAWMRVIGRMIVLGTSGPPDS